MPGNSRCAFSQLGIGCKSPISGTSSSIGLGFLNRSQPTEESSCTTCCRSKHSVFVLTRGLPPHLLWHRKIFLKAFGDLRGDYVLDIFQEDCRSDIFRSKNHTIVSLKCFVKILTRLASLIHEQWRFHFAEILTPFPGLTNQLYRIWLFLCRSYRMFDWLSSNAAIL